MSGGGVTAGGAASRRQRAIALRVLRALAVAVGTVLVAVIAMQLLLALAPGDPIDLLPNADEVRPVLASQWDLDRPVAVRIALWIGHLIQGDLGTSLAWRPGAVVSSEVALPLARSLGWWSAAGSLSVALSVLLGWPEGRAVTAARWSARAVSLVPVFLLAHLVVEGFDRAALALMARQVITRPTWFPLPLEPSPVRWAVAVVVLGVASASLSDGMVAMRATAARLRAAPFVLAARSRGEPLTPLFVRHGLLAITDLVASRAAVWLGSLVILEKVLLLNGAGRVLWDAAVLRDYPVAMGITVAFASWIAAVRLGADTVRIILDPRGDAP